MALTFDYCWGGVVRSILGALTGDIALRGAALNPLSLLSFAVNPVRRCTGLTGTGLTGTGQVNR